MTGSGSSPETRVAPGIATRGGATGFGRSPAASNRELAFVLCGLARIHNENAPLQGELKPAEAAPRRALDDASGKVEDAAVARTDDAVSTRLVAGHASQMRTYCTKRVEPAWPVDDEYLPGPGHEDGSEGYLRGDAFGPYETNSPEFLA